ncbi:hypothetical protein HAP94_04495 [Acidithiobacillus ferrivorans]|nr:hypothetical protein [Acidithiobacillus ferrivorans]
MKKFTIISAIAVAIAALSPTIAAADTAGSAMNSLGLFGEVAGSTMYGSPGAGAGITGGITFGRNWFANATVRYDFGAGLDSNGTSGGHTLTADVKGGYLFHLSSAFAIGPYVGFDHYGYAATFAVPGNPATKVTAGEEELGGGLYAAWSPVARLTFLTSVGGYDGLGANAQVNGNRVPAYSSVLVQSSLKAYYRVSGPLYAFVGFQSDDYTGLHGDNFLRGDVGVAYSY